MTLLLQLLPLLLTFYWLYLTLIVFFLSKSVHTLYIIIVVVRYNIKDINILNVLYQIYKIL